LKIKYLHTFIRRRRWECFKWWQDWYLWTLRCRLRRRNIRGKKGHLRLQTYSIRYSFNSTKTELEKLQLIIFKQKKQKNLEFSLLLVWPGAALGGGEGAGEALLIGEGKGKWDWETEEPAMHQLIQN
jgi:hypothetical protein